MQGPCVRRHGRRAARANQRPAALREHDKSSCAYESGNLLLSSLSARAAHTYLWNNSAIHHFPACRQRTSANLSLPTCTHAPIRWFESCATAARTRRAQLGSHADIQPPPPVTPPPPSTTRPIIKLCYLIQLTCIYLPLMLFVQYNKHCLLASVTPVVTVHTQRKGTKNPPLEKKKKDQVMQECNRIQQSCIMCLQLQQQQQQHPAQCKPGLR